MANRQLDLIRAFNPNFRNSLDQIWERFRDQERVETTVHESVLNLARGDIPLEGLGGGEEGAAQWVQLEAIILAALRPAYFVRNDEIILQDSPVEEDANLLATIKANKDDLENVIKGVGRVDLFNHFTHSYAGTGWLIDDDIAVTNRHVARVFAMQNSFGKFDFRIGTFGERIDARLDYVRQHNTNRIRRRADVFDVIYIAEDSQPDMAFLRVDNIGGVEPLRLRESPVAVGTQVAAVGYPASDGGRNDPVLMEQLFEGLYDVKRFAPGLVTDRQNNSVVLTTDYTSLGGNSGSPVLELDSGDAVGLHFAGAFRDANFAVASDVVAAARARLKSSVFFSRDAVASDLTEDPVTAAGDFEGRQGYDPKFLGENEFSVPLPALGDWEDDIAEVDNDADNVLRYTHFSVVQSVSRRLPLYTAVNIDGDKTFSLKRKGTWRADGRISRDDQIGNVLYRNNPLDRGHMVRRKDPGWGETAAEAQRAEIDTFHYTNSVPQHKDLNQRQRGVCSDKSGLTLFCNQTGT